MELRVGFRHLLEKFLGNQVIILRESSSLLRTKTQEEHLSIKIKAKESTQSAPVKQLERNGILIPTFGPAWTDFLL